MIITRIKELILTVIMADIKRSLKRKVIIVKSLQRMMRRGWIR